MCTLDELVLEEPQFDCVPPSCQSIEIPLEIPKSYKKVVLLPDGLRWKEACIKEFDPLKSKSVWTLVDRPFDRKVIRGMWLFRRKALINGGVNYKALYVALGNTQVEGNAYHDTFAPTGKPASLRLLVAVASIHSWDIHQMDVVTAFLNSKLNDEICVKQPEGFKDVDHPNKVCRLHKSFYGLKQSPRIWKDDIKSFILSVGFVQCKIDHCTYIRSDIENDKFTSVYIHVNDLVSVLSSL